MGLLKFRDWWSKWGRGEESEAPLDRPARSPDEADLGDIRLLVQSGRGEEAEQRLRRHLGQQPDAVEALQFLGLICYQSARNAEAARLLARAVALAPEVAFLQANYAQVLRAGGDAEGAERHARNAVRLAPEHADFRFNLALMLVSRQRHAEAIQALDVVLASHPDRVDALALKADACFELGRLDNALSLAERASALAPGDVALRVKLLHTRAWACDWSHREEDVLALRGILERCVERAGEASGTTSGTASGTTSGEMCAGEPDNPIPVGLSPLTTYEYPLPQGLRDTFTRRYVDDIRRGVGAALAATDSRGSSVPGRLRLGYLSANFNSHPMMHLLGSYFGLHDRKRFEVFGYSIGIDDGSEYRRRAVAAMDRFIDLRSLSARDAATRIREDGIDILIDLMGFTFDARPDILALRPAPVQVAWLGYPASSGPGLNDYAIVDCVVAPSEAAGQFFEKLVWMPHAYQVNDHRQAIAAEAPSRSQLGLPESAFVFACFNHVRKIEPQVFALWMRILRRVQGSVMWLYGSNLTACENLKREALRHGIEGERIVFGGTLPKPDHLARLSRADLFLDTFTYNAHTSASDALWAGVPVVTRPGDAFPARVGASLAAAAGLAELICDSEQAYEELAVRLAGNRAELARLRSVLTARERLPLFDTPRFTRDIEHAFEAMWRRHKAGAAAESFPVG